MKQNSLENHNNVNHSIPESLFRRSYNTDGFRFSSEQPRGSNYSLDRNIKENTVSNSENRLTALSTLSNSKTMIVMNPKGKLLHGYHMDIEEERKANQENEDVFEQSMADLRELIQLGDAELMAQNIDISECINLFDKHKSYFTILIIFQFIFDITYNTYGYFYYMDTQKDMQMFYNQQKLQQLWYFYWLLYSCEIAYCVIFYSLAVCTLCQKNIKLWDSFNVQCLMGMLSQMIQAYIQRFNVVTFFSRVIMFQHSKYICDLLIKIIFQQI